jgi:hypothetical protein
LFNREDLAFDFQDFLQLFDWLIETKRGVTLFEYSGADYTPGLVFQVILVMVFDNQQTTVG